MPSSLAGSLDFWAIKIENIMKAIVVKRKAVITVMTAVLMGIASCTKKVYESSEAFNQPMSPSAELRPEVSGLRVLEWGSETPVAGASVQLELEGEMSQVFQPTVLTTDQEGRVSWPDHWKVKELCVEETAYHHGSCGLSAVSADQREGRLTLSPKSWFRLQAVDLEDLNNDEFIRIELPIYNERIGYIELDAWEEALVPVYGNRSTEVYYTVRSSLDPDEVIESLRVSAYCEGGETLDLKVPY